MKTRFSFYSGALANNVQRSAGNDYAFVDKHARLLNLYGGADDDKLEVDGEVELIANGNAGNDVIRKFAVNKT